MSNNPNEMTAEQAAEWFYQRYADDYHIELDHFRASFVEYVKAQRDAAVREYKTAHRLKDIEIALARVPLHREVVIRELTEAWKDA